MDKIISNPIFTIALVLIIILIAILYIRRKKTNQKDKEEKKEEIKETKEEKEEVTLPYKKKKYFFTKRELYFYKILKPIAEKYNLIIFSKTRVADILEVSQTDKRQIWLNKITSKHIDFLLCSNDVCTPKILIELDDSSHDSTERRQRDLFIEKAMETAEIPLLRFRDFTSEQIDREIEKALTLTTKSKQSSGKPK